MEYTLDDFKAGRKVPASLMEHIQRETCHTGRAEWHAEALGGKSAEAFIEDVLSTDPWPLTAQDVLEELDELRAKALAEGSDINAAVALVLGEGCLAVPALRLALDEKAGLQHDFDMLESEMWRKAIILRCWRVSDDRRCCAYCGQEQAVGHKSDCIALRAQKEAPRGT